MKDASALESAAVAQVASQMAAAARTAPKTRGVDNIRVFAVDDPETQDAITKKMAEIGRRDNRPSMVRDSKTVATAPVWLVLGVASNPADIEGCGYCGKKTCDELEKAGGVCAFNSIDLGIAACSAASVASQNRVDSRVMFSVGKACLELQLFSADVKQALGIPLSVTGKSPFFDRTS
jgi:uncharacterized ferredoxin-like protein